MDTYKSSPARLARLFYRGRERWKQRAIEKQHRVRALLVKVLDLRASRDQWKARARSAESELEQLNQTIASLSEKKTSV